MLYDRKEAQIIPLTIDGCMYRQERDRKYCKMKLLKKHTYNFYLIFAATEFWYKPYSKLNFKTMSYPSTSSLKLWGEPKG